MIRVDMNDQSVEVVDFPDKWQLLGGRALSAKILLGECDSTIFGTGTFADFGLHAHAGGGHAD